MFSLFTTFYLVESNEERQKELLFCLQKNVQNTLIQNVYIFLDDNNEDSIKKYVNENITDTTKIKFIYIKRVPTYGDWIEYSKWFANTLGDVSVFTNADIYLDDSIECIKCYVEQKESIVCLSRHEVVSDNEFVPHPNPQWSQDLWAISKENILSITNTFFLGELNIIPTGVYRCDNKLAYIFAMRGWLIYNPFPSIKCYHLQKDVSRSYGKLDTNIVGGLCFPSPTDNPSKPSGLDVSVMPIKTNNITKCAINKYLERNLFPKEIELTPKSDTTIVFYGASVTKQKEGYVHYFKKLTNYNVEQLGYGGMHLKDAGIVFIDDIRKCSPKYCFIEWFTPSIKNYPKNSLFQYLDIIVLNLLQINCIPIFLFLRGVTSLELFEDKLAIYKMLINEYCNPKNIPFIEVYKDIDVACKTDEELLRDTVHTNDVGSELYAKAIINYFNLYIKNIVNIKNITLPGINKYTNIKTLTFEQKCTTGILIEGNAELIGIYQDVGPFSCFCNTYVDGELKHEDRPIIDIHCDYIRPTLIFNYTFEEKLMIQISSKEVDYDAIVKRKINWEKYNKEGIFAQQKELRLHSLHYVGEINKVTLL